jgi:hypothetical protein
MNSRLPEEKAEAVHALDIQVHGPPEMRRGCGGVSVLVCWQKLVCAGATRAVCVCGGRWIWLVLL